MCVCVCVCVYVHVCVHSLSAAESVLSVERRLEEEVFLDCFSVGRTKATSSVGSAK